MHGRAAVGEREARAGHLQAVSPSEWVAVGREGGGGKAHAGRQAASPSEGGPPYCLTLGTGCCWGRAQQSRTEPGLCSVAAAKLYSTLKERNQVMKWQTTRSTGLEWQVWGERRAIERGRGEDWQARPRKEGVTRGRCDTRTRGRCDKRTAIAYCVSDDDATTYLCNIRTSFLLRPQQSPFPSRTYHRQHNQHTGHYQGEHEPQHHSHNCTAPPKPTTGSTINAPGTTMERTSSNTTATTPHLSCERLIMSMRKKVQGLGGLGARMYSVTAPHWWGGRE